MTEPNALFAVERSLAFRSRPWRGGLSPVHVPFDTLTRDASTEATLGHAVLAGERIAIWGRSGTGKTSTVNYTLDSLGPDVVPIQVPVAADSPDVASRPQAFASQILRCVATTMADRGLLDRRGRSRAYADAAPQHQVTARQSRGVGAGTSAGISLSVAREIADEVSSVVTATAADTAASARVLLDSLTDRGYTPILVIDDSDSWAIGGGVEPHELIGIFFGPVLRIVADELDVGVVAAVHDHYAGSSAFAPGTTPFDRAIHLPSLPGAAAVSAILQARLGAWEATQNLRVEDVLDEGALQELFDAYVVQDRSIRAMLTIADTAVKFAADSNASRVSASHIGNSFNR